jgi:PAS domain S-box-containing protein
MGNKNDTTTGLKGRKFGSSSDGLDSASIGFSDDRAQTTANELLDKLSKKNRYDLVIKDVIKWVHKSIRLEEVLENSVDGLIKNIDKVNSVGIYMIEENVAVLKSQRGFSGRYIEKAGRIPYPKGLTWRTILDGKPIYCSDVDKDILLGYAGRELGIKSYLSMPIHFQAKVVGVTSINSCQKNAFDEEDLKLLEVIAQQLEIAVHNAKQAEALRSSEEKFRNLVEQTNDWVWEVDKNGAFIYVSPQVYEIIGYRPEEVIGKTTFDFMASNEASRFNEVVGSFIEKNAAFTRLEKTLIHKNGYSIVVETSGSPVFDSQGVLQGYRGIARDITERKDREEELRVLNYITKAMNQSVNLEEIYDVALDKITELGYVELACIYLVDEVKGEAVMQAQRNFPSAYAENVARIPYPNGLTWKVIRTGEIVNIRNARDDSGVERFEWGPGLRSMLGIPVAIEGKTAGVIWLFSYEGKDFTKPEEELLTSIGSQIAIAIAKANLYRELSKKKRYEEIIGAVTRSVHQSLDLQKVIDSAVAEISKNIESAENVGIYLVEDDEAVLRAYSGFHDGFVKHVNRITYPKGFIWRTIIDGKPIYCPDVDQDTAIGPAGREAGTKSYVSMPIYFDGKTIGAIGISSFLKKNAFTDVELKLLEIVAQQIELAISNAAHAEALRESNLLLEAKVLERTRELTKTNTELRKEITKRKKVEKQLISSLRDKEVLLKEVFHRVKNNLQVVSSLLELQSECIEDEKVVRMLAETQDRIISMAFIHEQLYESSDMATLNFEEYISTLVSNFVDSYGISTKDIRINTDICKTELGIDRAIPCGLLINEILSNSLKYAFPDKRGEISIKMSTDDQNYTLRIQDNGIGLPVNFDIKKSETLGFQLIMALIQQLGGSSTIGTQAGTEFAIVFPK